MRLIQLSDWHLGITSEKQLRNTLKLMKGDAPDILINCGDNNGGFDGSKATKRVIKLIREFFPTVPICWVNGNHDHWCRNSRKRATFSGASIFDPPEYTRAYPNPEIYRQNLNKIKEELRANNIHYFDEDGLYVHPDFPDIIFIGASGWYNNPTPFTNDGKWLPKGLDGDTNRSILRATEKRLFEHISLLDNFYTPDKKVVFVSHFPVIDVGDDYKGSFEDFCWDKNIGTFMQDNFNCKYFLCGHSHRLHQGPLRYECGSDYMKPAYQIIEV